MIGTPSNKEILDEAGLLADDGRQAAGGDVIIALRAANLEAGEAALAEAEALLGRSAARGDEAARWRPRSLAAAFEALPGAGLALISVPGAFAAAEARKALRRGLHVLLFSDNVPLAEECALKEEARRRGLLLMGPDCGTALISGTPLAFANRVRRGVRRYRLGLGDRPPGGLVPDRPRRRRRLARHRGRQPRPRRGGRRRHDPDGDRRPRRGPRNRARGAAVEAAGAGRRRAGSWSGSPKAASPIPSASWAWRRPRFRPTPAGRLP